MDLYYLPAFAVFAALAATVAFVYLGCASLAAWIAGLLRQRRQRGRVSRPGEAVRSVLAGTDARLRRLGNALLLFISGSLLLSVFGERGWWSDLPLRLWAILAVGLLVLFGFAMVRLQQLVAYRWRLLRLLEMHEDVALRLTEAQMRGNRVHFAVPAGGTCIDNVVTGPNGIYALRILPPPPGAQSVSLENNYLNFEPGGERFDLARTFATSRALAKVIEQDLDVRALIQPVVIVPGCRISSGNDGRCLVVNRDTCVSFVGWRNSSAYLMEDEIERIDEWLSAQTVSRDRETRRAAAATLGNAVPPPALV
ncbi:MAG: hypothetical protein ACR2QB_03135 [Gammaproteobacteria bacterium]